MADNPYNYVVTDAGDGKSVVLGNPMSLIDALRNSPLKHRVLEGDDRRSLDWIKRASDKQAEAAGAPKPAPPQPQPRAPAAPSAPKPGAGDSKEAQGAPRISAETDDANQQEVKTDPKQEQVPRSDAGRLHLGRDTGAPAEEAAKRTDPPPATSQDEANLIELIRKGEPIVSGDPHPKASELRARVTAATGDPVDLFAGQYTLEAVDLSVPSHMADIALVRRYRSGTTIFGPWGFGWDHNHNIFLRRLNDGRLALWTGEHHEQHFEIDAAGGWICAPEMACIVEPLPTPASGFDILFSKGERWRFEYPPGWSNAERIPIAARFDRHGNALHFTYGLHDMLASVLDEAGRGLLFEYGKCQLLERVFDHTRTRMVSYRHHAEIEHLVQVILPPTAGFPAGATTRYEYDWRAAHPAMRHNILWVMDARDRIFVENVYAGPEAGWSFNTLIWQRSGDFETRFEYEQIQWVPADPVFVNELASRTLVQHPDGSLHIYTFNYRGDLLDHRFRLRMDGSARVVATSYSYDACGNLIEKREADGQTTTYGYDATNPDPRARRNLLSIDRSATLSGIVKSRRVFAARYENRYQLPVEIKSEGNRATLATYDFDVGQATPTGRLVRLDRPNATWVGEPISKSSLKLQCNARGQMTELVTSDGARTAIKHGGAGPTLGFVLETVRDADDKAATEEVEYDSCGFSERLTDPAGEVTELSVNALGQVELIILPEVDGAKAQIRQTYGPAGEVVRVERPGSIPSDPPFVDVFEHDAQGFRRSAVRAMGTTRAIQERAENDHVGRPFMLWSPTGSRTDVSYDERGCVLEETRAAESAEPRTTRYRYDIAGRLAGWTDAVGRETVVHRDIWGRARHIDRPNGARETLSWGVGDALVEQVVVDKANPGDVLKKTTWVFDQRERCREITRWVQGSAGLTAVTTRYRYDDVDRLIEVTGPRGGTQRSEYDGLSRLKLSVDPDGNRRALTYDAAGNVAEINETINERGSWRTRLTTQKFDARRLLRQVATPSKTIDFAVDLRGMVVERIDAGVTTRFDLGPHGELDEMTVDPGGLSLSSKYTYDAELRIATFRDPTGELTRWTRNSLGEIEAIELPDGTSWTRRLDLLGRPLETIAPSGAKQHWTYGFDDAPSQTSSTTAAGLGDPGVHDFSYDALGRVKTATNALGMVELAYDGFDRIIREAAAGYVFERKYDDLAGTADAHFPDGRRERIIFDASERPIRIELSTAGSLGGTPGVLVEIDYSQGTRVQNVRFAGGAETEYRYDDDGRVTNVEMIPSQGAGRTQATLHDARGHRAIINLAGPANDSRLHKFDAQNRLIDVAMIATGSTIVPDKPSGQAAAVLAAGSGTPAEGYKVDQADARYQRDVAGPPASVTNYVNIAGHRLSAVNGVPVVHHIDGARVSDDRLLYMLDARSRVTAVTDVSSGAEIASFDYDALGRVAAGTLAGQQFKRWFDGGQCVEQELGPSRRQWTRCVGAPLPWGGIQAGQAFFLHRDAAMTTLGVTDEDGRLLEAHDFDTFGQSKVTNALGQAIAGRGRQWWRGMEWIGAIELYAMQARVYDPATGLFLSRDPQLNRDSPNPYAFAAHNPVDFADPTGREKAPVAAPPDWTTFTEWAPPAGEFDIIPLIRRVDTGNRPINFVLNKIIFPWNNLLATVINTFTDALGQFDRAARGSRFSSEYDCLNTMGPMMRTMGLAMELPGGIEYLRYFLTTHRATEELKDVALNTVFMSGVVGAGSAGKLPRRSGVEARFMREMLDIILSNDKHPLRFLVDPKSKDWVSRKASAETVATQAGHLTSRWWQILFNEVERFAVEDAFFNQYTNWTGETGRRAAFVKPAVEIEGVFVEYRSLQSWANQYPELQKFLEAPKSPGWTAK